MMTTVIRGYRICYCYYNYSNNILFSILNHLKLDIVNFTVNSKTSSGVLEFQNKFKDFSAPGTGRKGANILIISFLFTC